AVVRRPVVPALRHEAGPRQAAHLRERGAGHGAGAGRRLAGNGEAALGEGRRVTAREPLSIGAGGGVEVVAVSDFRPLPGAGEGLLLVLQRRREEDAALVARGAGGRVDVVGLSVAIRPGLAGVAAD